MEQAKSVGFMLCGRSLTDLSGIEALENIELIYLFGTHAQPLDLTPLSGLKSLNELALSRAKVKDLNVFQKFPALKKLNISDSDLNDVAPLSGLTNLTKLTLNRNAILDFRPLKTLVDTGATVNAQNQEVQLPAAQAGFWQANPGRGPNGELPQIRPLIGFSKEDQSAWLFPSASTRNRVSWSFNGFAATASNFVADGEFYQQTLASAPVLVDDAVTIDLNVPLTPEYYYPYSFDVLVNDWDLHASAIDFRTLKLVNAQGQPVESLTFPAGKFEVDSSRIKFTPTAGSKDLVPEFKYQVANWDGMTSTATVRVDLIPKSQTVVVVPPTDPAKPDPAQPAGNPAPAGKVAAASNGIKATAQDAELANTGAATSAPLALAGLLLLAGLAATLLSRRRAT